MVVNASEVNARTWKFKFLVALWLGVCCWLVFIGLHQIAGMASIALAIYTFGFRERWQGENVASAYSVFNEGGQEIGGTFNAKQFDRQLRGIYGAAVDDDDDGVAGVPVHVATAAPAQKIDDAEKLRRRKAAAAAAEKRFESSRRAAATEAAKA